MLSSLSLTAILLLGLAAAAGLVALLAWPTVALRIGFVLLMVGSTKFRNRSAEGLLDGSLDAQIWFELGVFATVGLIALRNFVKLDLTRLPVRKVELAVLGYIAVALASSTWGMNPSIAAVRSFQLLTMAAFAFVAVRRLGPTRALHGLLGSALFFVLACTSITLLFPWTSSMQQRSLDFPRFSWFAAHPLVAATYAASAALYVLARLLFDGRGSRRAQLLGWPMFAATAGVLVATRSRGALAGFAGAVGVLLLARYLVGPRARRSYAVLAVTMCVAALLLVIGATEVASWGNQSNVLRGLVLRGGTLEGVLTLNGRTDIWVRALPLIAASPLFGYGYLASRSILLQQLKWAGHTHNALTESLLNLGIVGSLALWSVVLGTALRAFRNVRRDTRFDSVHPAVLACVVFLLLNSVVGPSFAGPPDYEFLLLVLLAFVTDHLVATPAPVRQLAESREWHVSDLAARSAVIGAVRRRSVVDSSNPAP